MLRRLNVRWRAALVVMLSVLLIATPAMTGFTAAKVMSIDGCPPCETFTTEVMNNPELKGLIQRYQTSGMPLNEGKVQEVRELQGKTKQKILNEALTFNDVRKLRAELEKQGFKPSWQRVTTLQASTELSGQMVSTSITAIPFTNGDELAVITFVSNEYGKAAAATVKKDGALTINIYDRAKDRVMNIASTWTCAACQVVVSWICDYFGTKLSYSGCVWLCLKSANPIIVAACTGICFFMVYTLGSTLACTFSSGWICAKVGLCP